jgi:hypothetical protein
MYDAKYSPYYTVAFSVNVVMCTIAVCTVFTLRYILSRGNKKMDEKERLGGIEMEGVKLVRHTL